MNADRRRTAHDLAQEIEDGEYVRQRWAPKPGDPFYLHLSDLRLAVERIKRDEPLVVLDYGCGGSPYRGLFPGADYRRADYAGNGLEYVIQSHQRVDEADNVFDLILSTQVAEHVRDPFIYFAECRRLLRPGGTLVCTTHGTYEDHGCPDDYRRWTADGLAADLSRSEFEVRELLKLTTGSRALIHLIERFGGRRSEWRGFPLSPALWFAYALLRIRPGHTHRQCDRWFAKQRLVTRDEDGHTLYIALMAVAVKV